MQRRPLVAYWREPSTPAYLQVRLVKDDFDFASGLLYSVQNENYVLAAACFRSDGGDKHLTLDPVEDGAFSARRLFLQVLISGLEEMEVLLEGRAIAGKEQSLPLQSTSRVVVRADQALIAFVPRLALFGKEKPTISFHPTSAGEVGHRKALAIEVDLLRRDRPEVVRWSEVQTAFVAFGLALDVRGDAAAFDEIIAACPWKVEEGQEQGGLKLGEHCRGTGPGSQPEDRRGRRAEPVVPREAERPTRAPSEAERRAFGASAAVAAFSELEI